MKFLTKLLLATLFLAPFTASATISVPWTQKNLTDTFFNPAPVNGNNLRGLIGTTTEPANATYNDLFDFSSSTNDFLSIGIWNFSMGGCATAEYDANSNIGSVTNNYTALGITGSAFTGVGCVNTPYTGFGANSTYLLNPNGNINFSLGTSSTGVYQWFGSGFDTPNVIASLTQSGSSYFAGPMGIGTTSPYAKLSVHANSLETNRTLFAIGSSTPTATTTLFVILNNGNVGIGTSSPFKTLSVNGIIVSAPGGTPGTSGYGFGDSPSTGLFEPAPGDLRIADAGTQVFRSAGTSNGFINLAISSNLNIVPPASGLYSQGFGGFGTTTPFGRLSIHANAIDTNSRVLFAIGSSTATATTTLLIFDNNGIMTVPQSGSSFGNGNSGIAFTVQGGSLRILRAAVGDGSLSVLSGGISLSSVGFLSFQSLSQERARFDNAGDLGIGTTTPYALVSISTPNLATGATTTLFAIASSTSGTATTTLFTVTNTGAVYAPFLTASAGLQTGVVCTDANGQFINDSVACVASAARFKQQITPLSAVDSLNEILKLQPVSFYYKSDFNGSMQSNSNYNGEQIGFIADEVQKIDPRLVVTETHPTTFEGKDYPAGAPASFRYENVTALLAGAIQAQQAEIDQLRGGTKEITRSTEENWQWIAIGLLVVWNVGLTLKRRK